MLLFSLIAGILVGYALTGMSVNPDPATRTAAAPLVFGWKRVCYVTNVDFNIEVSPWKQSLLIVESFRLLFVLNSGVAWSAAACASFDDIVTFVVIDWLTCALRMGLLVRWGFTRFPKIFNYLLEKQLENVPTPLPRGALSLGHKTCMRLHQAFFCLCEGLTLSATLGHVMVYFIINFYIVANAYVWHCFPAKNVFLLLVLLLSDVFQDFVCSVSLNKFSTWSFILSTGLFNKKFFWIWWMAICVCTHYGYLVAGSGRSRIVETGYADFFTTNWATSPMAMWQTMM